MIVSWLVTSTKNEEKACESVRVWRWSGERKKKKKKKKRGDRLAAERGDVRRRCECFGF